MNQTYKIFEKIKPVNHSIKSEYTENKIRIKDKDFSIKSIYKVLEHVKWVKEKREVCKTKIIIDSEFIVDQAIITLFEIIIFFLINEWNYNISYRFTVNKRLLGFQVFKKSILYKYNNRQIDRTAYNKDYNSKFLMEREHFRKICENNPENKKNEFLSITMDEIDLFFRTFDIDNEYRGQLTEAISEILDNSLKHSESDFIININVIKNEHQKYKYIDVSIVSIDDVSFGTEIEKYIHNNNKSEYSENNRIILKALENHEKYFNPEYNMENFCVLSAFQKSVTTRKLVKNTCGTGLTTLIKALMEGASENFCYVITGKTNMIFRKEFLNLDENGYIGFNTLNDYITNIPEKKNINVNKYDMNVNIYNLQFMFKENKNER